jgi:hypothetical protein
LGEQIETKVQFLNARANATGTCFSRRGKKGDEKTNINLKVGEKERVIKMK